MMFMDKKLFVLLCLVIIEIASSLRSGATRSNSKHRRNNVRNFSSKVPLYNPPLPGLHGGSVIGSSGIIGGIGGRSGGGGGGINMGGVDVIADDSGKRDSSTGASNDENSLLAKFLASYSKLLIKYPYRTKIISSAIIGGIGDILIQLLQRYLDKSDKPFDFRRLLVFCCVTGFYIAPVIHVWFGWLDKMPLPAAILKPGKFNEVMKALSMMIVDQTVGATVITIGFFYAFELAQKLIPPYSANPESFLVAGLRTTKNSLWETLVANWYCWPIINFVNFLVIPVNYRVLFSNLAAVFWNMFLSSVANR